MGAIPLLKHQVDFIRNDKDKHIGLVAGYGSGKTFGFISKAYDLAAKNVGYTGILLEPTAPLLNDILIPDFISFLDDNSIPYSLVKSPQPNLTIYFHNGSTKILLRSAENWQRLIGVNAAFIGLDEFDTIKKETALIAYKKLQGRLRSGKVRQMFSATTPEGFGAAYELFEKQKKGELLRAETFDNPFLPQDFIDDLLESYPPNLIESYLRGIFTNLTTGTVYNYFDRKRHDTLKMATDFDVLHIGQDFNVGGCVSTVHVIDVINKKQIVSRVDEFESHDTPTIITNIRERYPKNKIVIYPDASGDNDNSNASKSDIRLLRDANFTINAPSRNGAIKDRVNAYNGLLSHDRYFINTLKCPKGTEAIEQQAYDKNGKPEKFSEPGSVDDYADSSGYFIVRKFPIISREVITSKFKVA